MSPSINFKRFYDVFREISTTVHSSTSVDEVAELVVWKATAVLGAKGAVLRIFNLGTQELELFASYGLGENYLSKAPVSNLEVITDFVRLNQVEVIKDILADPRVEHLQELREEGVQMILDVPIILRTDIMGIIRILFDERREFADEELNFVGAVAETCACAIDKARMIEEKQSQYDHLALQTEKLSALGRMAAGIAHEINNPLAGILLFSSNLRKKVPDEGPLPEGLDVIIRESQRCKGIIQDLLEFSRDKEPKKTLANPNDIIGKAVSIVENELHLRHISVERELSVELPEILLDANLMQQVFVNFLINAAEAIDQNGQIRIKTDLSPGGKKALVEITDNGCGISPEDIPKIFEPFFSTKSNGTGLGLAVSYGIIKKHKGDIHVTITPGRGTCFTIEIPITR